MAALAVAGELHALFFNEQVDVFEIPGRSKGIGMGGLTPLVVAFLVAVAAVLRREEAFWAHELAVVAGGVRGQKGRLLAEGVVVFGRDVLVVVAGRDGHPGSDGGGCAGRARGGAKGAFVGRGGLLS